MIAQGLNILFKELYIGLKGRWGEGVRKEEEEEEEEVWENSFHLPPHTSFLLQLKGSLQRQERIHLPTPGRQIMLGIVNLENREAKEHLSASEHIL